MTMHEHEHHLRVMFELLKDATLYVNKEKCIFAMNSVNFFGFITSKKRAGKCDKRLAHTQER